MRADLFLPPALLAMVLTLAVLGCRPLHEGSPEAVLRVDLKTLREVIGQYHRDRGSYPETLDALIASGYLRKLPIDPFTRSDATWRPVYEPAAGAGGRHGIVDVRSGAPGSTRSGVPLERL